MRLQGNYIMAAIETRAGVKQLYHIIQVKVGVTPSML
jgi:hypothetical protein